MVVQYLRRWPSIGRVIRLHLLLDSSVVGCPTLIQCWVHLTCSRGFAENTIHSPNAGLMLARRLRVGLTLTHHWVNISCLLD